MRLVNRGAAVIVLSIAIAACGGEPRSAAPARSASPPVILISVDTLRADHLPAYGYRGVATPAIDALRADGIRYDNAWSHAPTTLPSHVSILTGRLPYQHAVRNNIGYTFDGAATDSLPAMLKRRGYATGAAVSAWVLRANSGLGPLFDSYDDQVGGAADVAIANVARDGAATVTIAEQWVGQHASQPFFYFLHLFEPHTPYAAPEPFRSQFSNPYDAEIAAADAAVGRFIEKLKALGVYERALIILLSDHGEGLGDHGESEHGVFLYREVLRVPLIVKLPGSERAGTSVAVPVQLIDVAPTIASLTSAAPLQPFAGSSLLDASAAPRPIYSETMLPRIHFGWSGLRSLVGEGHHYIEAPRSELYDLVADPHETNNVAGLQRRVLADMRKEMEQHAAELAQPAVVGEEDAAKLAALGYLGQTRPSEEEGLRDPKDGIRDLEALKAAAALEHSGELEAAAAKYRSIVAGNPRFADAWFRLAAVEEKLGQVEKALQSYRAGITAAPLLAPQVGTAVAALHLRLRQYAEAEAHARLSMESHPGAAHHLLGRVALERGDLAAAEREARLAQSDTLYADAATVLLATIEIARGRTAEGLRMLDALKAERRTPVRDLESTRGDALARLERVTEAEAAFRAEIASFPQNRDAYARLALLYAALGRSADAERMLEQMFARERSRASAELAAETWEAAGQAAAAAKWRRRAAR